MNANCWRYQECLEFTSAKEYGQPHLTLSIVTQCNSLGPRLSWPKPETFRLTWLCQPVNRCSRHIKASPPKPFHCIKMTWPHYIAVQQPTQNDLIFFFLLLSAHLKCSFAFMNNVWFFLPGWCSASQSIFFFFFTWTLSIYYRGVLYCAVFVGKSLSDLTFMFIACLTT